MRTLARNGSRKVDILCLYEAHVESESERKALASRFLPVQS